MQTSNWGKKIRKVTQFWILCATIMFSLSVTAQTIPIPDPHFKAFLVTHYDTNGDGEIQVSEARAVAGTMDTPGGQDHPGQITDLTGIEYFTDLTGLDCSYEQLTTLDVHANKALKFLYCAGNHLTSLDVHANQALEELLCSSNRLTVLDVSAHPALEELLCFSNRLTALNARNDRALQLLSCFSNRLTTLDVRNDTALRNLACSSNQLTRLDVTTNTALTVLTCYSNRLTALDLRSNRELENLECDKNQLTALDVSENRALRYLQCGANWLRALDVSVNPTLIHLRCEHNWLTTLDVSALTALEGLWCDDNDLTALNVRANKVLQILHCGANQLTALDVKTNTLLTDLHCENNRLTKLDVRANTALTDLSCSSNQLTTLDVSANTALTDLSCYDNHLTKLDVSANTALTDLYCYSNQLTTLNASTNTALTDLNCNYNQLTTLDVSANKALWSLNCSDNQLTKLDVRANKALGSLNCSENQLTTLDVSANTALKELNCFSNQLTDIPDVTGCTGLIDYRCDGNDFNADDCPTIAAIEAMGLSTFAYNPQADGSTLDCFGDTTITRSAAGGDRIHPGRREETQVPEDPIALSLPPRPAWRLGVDFTEVPGLSKVPPDVRKRLLVPVPLKGLLITDTKKRAWANWLARRLEATVKDIGTLSIAGRVSPELSYAVFALRGDDKGWELALIRENDGALIYRRELSMYIPDEHDWIDPTRVGAFSFDISKEKALYGLVIAGATGIPFKYGISGTGGWMVLVVSGNRLASAKTLGQTCDADINDYKHTDSLSSSRAYVVDADGDGYRDLLLWKRMFASAGSSGNGEDSKGCMTLKSEAVQLAHFYPDALDFELQSSVPGEYALRDDLWYPAAWGYAQGEDDIEKPWAGCDGSDPGFEWSEFLTYLCPKDRARYPDDKSFVPSKQTGRDTGKTGK